MATCVMLWWAHSSREKLPSWRMAAINSWWREERSEESREEIHTSTSALRGTWEGVRHVHVEYEHCFKSYSIG